MVEINVANGVLGGSFLTSRGGITDDRCGAVEAVLAARPVSGDTSRTSISEGKAGEEESLDITQDGAGAPLCQKYNLSSGFVSHTIQVWYTVRVLKSTRTAKLRQGRGSTPVL